LTFADHLAAWVGRLEGSPLYWSTLEIGNLLWFTKPDDAIVNADVDSIMLRRDGAEVIVTREQISSGSQMAWEQLGGLSHQS
jgi:hypothetical protein